jgi:hypothetical protein
MTSPSSIKWSVDPSRVVHEILEDEVIAINLATGSYYSLDRVGTDVWALIETGADTDEIVRDIGRRYDGDPLEMEQAVVRLLDELRQEELIVADETRAGERTTAPTQHDDTGSERRRFEAPTLRKYTDMQELILLDPIHEVDDTGWPYRDPEPAK